MFELDERNIHQLKRNIRLWCMYENYLYLNLRLCIFCYVSKYLIVCCSF